MPTFEEIRAARFGGATKPASSVESGPVSDFEAVRRKRFGGSVATQEPARSEAGILPPEQFRARSQGRLENILFAPKDKRPGFVSRAASDIGNIVGGIRSDLRSFDQNASLQREVGKGNRLAIREMERLSGEHFGRAEEAVENPLGTLADLTGVSLLSKENVVEHPGAALIAGGGLIAGLLGLRGAMRGKAPSAAGSAAAAPSAETIAALIGDELPTAPGRVRATRGGAEIPVKASTPVDGPFRKTSVRAADVTGDKSLLVPYTPESRAPARTAAALDTDAALKELLDAAVPSETHPTITKGSVALNHAIEEILALPEAEQAAAMASRVQPGVEKLSKMATPTARGLAALAEFDPASALSSIKEAARRAVKSGKELTPEMQAKVARLSLAAKKTPEGSIERELAFGRLHKTLTGLDEPSGLSDLHRAYYRQQILTQFRSPVRAALGQLATSAFEEGLVRPFKPMAEKFVEMFGPKEMRNVKISTGGTRLREFAGGAKKGAQLHHRAWKEKILPFAEGDPYTGHRARFEGIPLLEQQERLGQYLYGGVDVPQRMATRATAGNEIREALAKSGTDITPDLEKKIVEYVRNEELQAAMQDTVRGPVKASTAISRIPILGPLLNAVPVAPMNVLMRGVYDYQPWGAIKPLLDYRANPNPITKAIATRAVSRAALGTGVDVGFGLARDAGITTGEKHPSEKVQQAKEESGIVPRAVQLGKTGLKTAILGPFNVHAALGGAVADALRKDEPGEIAKAAIEGPIEAFTSVIGQDTPGLQQIARLTQGKNKVEQVYDTLASFVSGHIPESGQLGHVAQGMDTVQRRPDAQGLMDDIKQTAALKIPGLRETVPAKESVIFPGHSVPVSNFRTNPMLRLAESLIGPGQRVARRPELDPFVTRFEREYELNKMKSELKAPLEHNRRMLLRDQPTEDISSGLRRMSEESRRNAPAEPIVNGAAELVSASRQRGMSPDEIVNEARNRGVPVTAQDLISAGYPAAQVMQSVRGAK